MKIPFRQYWNLLVNYLKPQRLRVTLLTVLLLSSIGLQLINPQLLSSFVDTAMAGGNQPTLLRIALLFVGLALINQVLSVTATYISENVAWSATNSLRADLAMHCLRLDLSFHKARTPGELIERIDGDVTALANFFSQFMIYVVGNLVLLLGVVVVLFTVDWRVGLSMSVFALIILALLVLSRSLAVPHWTASREAAASLFGFLEERLAGTEDIRSSGATSYMTRRLTEFMRERLDKERKAAVMGGIAWTMPVALFTLGFVMSFVLGGWLYRSGDITLGTTFLIYNYTGMLIRPLMLITNQMQDLQKASAGITRVQELYATEATLADGSGQLIPAGPLEVAFEDVTFGYEAGDPVLENVSFVLEPGKVLGVLGRTGSGKTTLTRLLFRLYDPQSGTLRLGGVDLRAARMEEIRERVGMVTQDVQLFHATVRDNLTLFDETISDERILEVLDDLGLDAWYRSLPEGLETKLQSGGSGLSSGEAQILAFTRVFLKDPGLIILDEASSRLDPATEHLTERAVDKLLRRTGSGHGGGRSAIIIAHRLQTVQRADAILIMEDGRIREYGPREQLANDPNSRFYSLLQTGLEEVLV